MVLQEGDLAEIPVAAVLIEALNERVTGVVRVDHGEGVSRLFLREGVPVAGQSFTAFRPLGAALAASGIITAGALEASLAEMARTGRRQGDVLVEMGAATREQVDRALAAQQSAYLAEIASLSRGRFSFDPGAEFPQWVEGVRISPLQAIVGALETPQAGHLVASALQGATSGALCLAPGYRKLAAAFGWSAAEAALVDRLAAMTRLDDFFVATPVAPERARAILAALLLMGLAAPQPGPGAAAPELVIDLEDLLATAPPEPPAVSVPDAAPQSAAPAGEPPVAGRRSDPDEARRRRQRLLQRAMQNMGVGPFASPPRAASPPTASPQPVQPTVAPAPVAPAPSAPDHAELRRAFAAASPRARSQDLFERLGVLPTATQEQVKAAYFQLARQLHPDRFQHPALSDLAGQVPEFFAAVNEAYEVLSSREKRAAYLAARAGSGGEAGRAQTAALEFEKAQACVRTRDMARARGHFEAAVRADPRPEYLATYAGALHATGSPADRDRARELADEALRDPRCDRAALVRGLIARDEGDHRTAEQLFRRALQANPQNVVAQRELRSAEARRGTAPGAQPGGPARKR